MKLEDKIKLAIDRQNINGAKKLLSELYEAEYRAEWLKAKQEEYDTLFKTLLVEVPAELDIDGNVVVEATSYYDYEEDCVSFTNWLAETVVVSEAVEEVTEVDADGMVTVVTPYQPEATELVRPYEPMPSVDVDAKVSAYLTSKYQELRANEYPSVYEYIDALVKGDTVAQQDYIDKCLAVKLKYPKV